MEWAAPPVLGSADPELSLKPATARLVDGSENFPKVASAESSVVMQSPSVPPVPAEAAPTLVIASAHPPLSASPADAPLAPATIPRSLQRDGEKIAILVERGKHLIASGDLAAARVVLGRAAESKDAAAALALGSTYDPVFLRELKTFGFAPDLEMARGWYEKAKEFGSEEAQRRIQILARSGS